MKKSFKIGNRKLLKLSRPLHLLLAALTYALGASIPAYLGQPLQSPIFWLGLALVLLAQLSMAWLVEIFRPHNEPLVEGETPQQKETLRNNMLIILISSLTTYTILTYLLFTNFHLTITTFYFLIFSIVLTFANAIPPIHLANRGFGELTLAAHIAYVIPSVAFLLQTGENHRLLTILLFPLTALALAFFLILNFTTFTADQKYHRATLLRSLTWERAVPFHHNLIIFAYFIFAISPLFGFSFSVIWPAFLTLPFAILQILLLRHISLGGKPNWPLLTVTALAVFGLTTYFLTLTFWLR